MPKNKPIRGLVIIAVVIFLVGVVWMALDSSNLIRQLPELLPLEDVLIFPRSVPQEQIDQVFRNARESVMQAYRSGNRWHAASWIADWITFLCAIAITGVAAFFGNPVNPNATSVDAALAVVRTQVGRNAWVVGILAALVAVSTPISERMETQATAFYRHGDRIMELVRETRNQIMSGNLPPEEILALLDKLEIEAAKWP